jgi:hypothetical protein
MTWQEWVEGRFAELLGKKATHLSKEEIKERVAATPFSKKALVVSGIVTLSAVVSGCGEPDYTAYDECQWEDDNGIRHNCEDDNDSFYASHSYSGKKHKLSSSSKYYQYQMSKGGIGSGSKSSSGG